MCEDILPIPEGTFPPKIEGAEEEIRMLAENKAREIYGDLFLRLWKSAWKRSLTQ